LSSDLRASASARRMARSDSSQASIAGIRAVAEGDMLRTQVAILRRLANYEPADTVAATAPVQARRKSKLKPGP